MKTLFDTAFWSEAKKRMRLKEFDAQYQHRFKKKLPSVRISGFAKIDMPEAIRVVRELSLDVDLSFMESVDIEDRGFFYDYFVRTNRVRKVRELVEAVDSMSHVLGPVLHAWNELRTGLEKSLDYFEREKSRLKNSRLREPPKIEEILNEHPN